MVEIGDRVLVPKSNVLKTPNSFTKRRKKNFLCLEFDKQNLFLQYIYKSLIYYSNAIDFGRSFSVTYMDADRVLVPLPYTYLYGSHEKYIALTSIR